MDSVEGESAENIVYQLIWPKTDELLTVEEA